MSLNAEREGGAGASLGLVQAQVPRLVPSGYAAWRPVMENVLMRAGVAPRDYKEQNADWAALVAAVDRWTTADEEASIAYALGRVSVSSSSTAGPTAAEKEARRGAAEAVARARRAYALLYQALSDELRRLVANVALGDAYGLWSWLEKRFQSTEQDNVGDLWDAFTQLSQESDESFDQYKARVDHVYGLLAHAKDKPSAGLYAHRLLWKLSVRYNPAVLALKASGKLKEAEKINWDEIVAFVNNHERSEQRLNGDDTMDGHAIMATVTMRSGQRGGAAETRNCFNCGKTGHLARNCKEGHRAAQRYEGQDDNDDESDEHVQAGGTARESTMGREGAAVSTHRRGRGGGGGGGRNQRVATALALTSDSDDSEEFEARRVRGHRVYVALDPNTKVSDDQDGRGRPRRMERFARRAVQGGLRW